jgi:hypothetical protein
MKGAIEGADKAKVEAGDIIKEAAEGIIDGATQTRAKTADLAERTAQPALDYVKDAAIGVLGAVKEILEKKK